MSPTLPKLLNKVERERDSPPNKSECPALDGVKLEFCLHPHVYYIGSLYMLQGPFVVSICRLEEGESCGGGYGRNRLIKLRNTLQFLHVVHRVRAV